MSSDRRIVVPGLSEPEQDEVDTLLEQWRAKRPRNNLRAGRYDMKTATAALMSSNAPEVVKRRRYVLGWSATAVDKLNRRCNLDGFYDTAGTDLSGLGLGDLERDNMLYAELSQAGVSSLIHAVSWLVRVRGDVASGEPKVLILPRDATTATGIWDVRRRGLRSFLSLNDFNDSGEPTAMTVYQPNLNLICTKEQGVWKLDRRDHSDGMPVHTLRYRPRLGRPFGSSRISRAVMSLHDQALAVMIRADVNGEAYSMPRYALLGATDEAFQNADGSPKATWQAAWDAVWAVGDDEDLARQGSALARADIKQFHGQSPEPQNAHLRMLAQMFSGETAIPIGELGLIGDSNPESEGARTVSKEDLISEAETTMDMWGPDISACVTEALRMHNDGDVPAKLDVRGNWRSPIHESRAAAADSGMKTLTMFPWLAETQVGLELSGLTADQISRALAEKKRAEGRRILGSLGARRGDES